jgi:hypothetical protein
MSALHNIGLETWQTFFQLEGGHNNWKSNLRLMAESSRYTPYSAPWHHLVGEKRTLCDASVASGLINIPHLIFSAALTGLFIQKTGVYVPAVLVGLAIMSLGWVY